MFLIVIVLSFVASLLVKTWMTRTYAKWSKIPNKAGLNGHTVARQILDSNNLQKVALEISEGQLSDHYIPSQKLMRLSQGINNEPSVASIAVAAHECGHAIQDKEGYSFLKLKAIMMPLAVLGNQFGLVLTIGASMLGNSLLMNTGLFMLLLGMLMPVLTLPIEFDASKRALEELTRLNMVDQNEYNGARSMLRAAAFTYVAGAASSMAILGLVLFRFVRR